MLTIKAVDLKPLTKKLGDRDVTVTIRRASLSDEGQRYELLFGDSETALMTDIAMVETWLTLVECDIVGGDGEPLLTGGMPTKTL